VTGSYCLSVSQKNHVSYYINVITACAQNVRLQHKSKTLMLLANRIFSNCVTQSGSLAVDASFQFVDV